MNIKLIIGISIGVIVILLLHQIIFSYRIIPFPNTGDLKHKTFGVFLFPHKHILLFNPTKKNKIASLIYEYIRSEEYQFAVEENFPNKTEFAKVYFNRIDKLNKEDIELASIKFEDKAYHILVRDKLHMEHTIVFRLDPKTDKIIGFY